MLRKRWTLTEVLLDTHTHRTPLVLEEMGCSCWIQACSLVLDFYGAW